MIRPLMITSACVLGLASPGWTQQPDMAAMQKWMTAKHVAWHMVGKYQGVPSVTSDGQGFADVTDVIEVNVTLDWQNGNTIVGTPAIKNAPSTVSKLRDSTPTCQAPVLNGAFEHATLDAVTVGQATALHFKMTRTYPAATVSQACTGTKVAPAKTTSEEVELFVPQPTFLAMGLKDSSIGVTPDKKSLILKSPPGFNGWVWTLTPTAR